MKDNLVRICDTIPARVNLKAYTQELWMKARTELFSLQARTHEKMDSVGECRALECHACVLLEKA